MQKTLIIYCSIISLLISSCKTGSETFSISKIEKRRYLNGYSFHFKSHIIKKQNEDKNGIKEIVQIAGQKALNRSLSIDTLSLSKIEKQNDVEKNQVESSYFSCKQQVNPVIHSNKQHLISSSKRLHELKKVEFIIKNKTKILPLEIKKNFSSRKVNVDITTDQILGVILSIIFPPLGVFIYTGFDIRKTLIALLLTILFWLPGLVYALLVIFDKL